MIAAECNFRLVFFFPLSESFRLSHSVLLGFYLMCFAVVLPALCQAGVSLRFYLDKQASHTVAYVQKCLRDIMKILLLS